MHGILGSKRNWRTPANVWRKMFPHYASLSIDHRGHSGSKAIKSPTGGNNTLHHCASDIIHLLDNQQMKYPTIILAHSFGGKVALQYLMELQARQALSENYPTHTWIIDTIPRPTQFATVDSVFKAIEELPHEFESKEWMMTQLISKGIDKPTTNWLATNIEHIPGSDKYHWAFDLTTVTQLFEQFSITDQWSFLRSFRGPGQIHFIRAGRNLHWTPEIIREFDQLMSENPYVKLHTMPHVGHWVHVDDLRGMYQLITSQSQLSPVVMP
jgi:pimeloyl-ACP methyl ester carboxylesterase